MELVALSDSRILLQEECHKEISHITNRQHRVGSRGVRGSRRNGGSAHFAKCGARSKVEPRKERTCLYSSNLIRPMKVAADKPTKRSSAAAMTGLLEYGAGQLPSDACSTYYPQVASASMGASQVLLHALLRDRKMIMVVETRMHPGSNCSDYLCP
jgi:hypothetical protein